MPRFDQNSAIPIFSTTKNFAAMLMGVALQNEWIESYDDEVIKHWPEFPTKRVIIEFDDWTQFLDECRANDTNCGEAEFIKYCNAKSIPLRKNYKVRIKDVLRHEGGFGLSLSEREITMYNTSYKDIKSLIEETEYLIYFRETNRNYHAFSRGYILNQIFMNVEPQKR